MVEQPFDVRIKMRGVERPIIWANVFAEDEFEAVERAIGERYWPPYFTEAPAGDSLRLTVTVTPVLPKKPTASTRRPSNSNPEEER